MFQFDLFYYIFMYVLNLPKKMIFVVFFLLLLLFFYFVIFYCESKNYLIRVMRKRAKCYSVLEKKFQNLCHFMPFKCYRTRRDYRCAILCLYQYFYYLFHSIIFKSSFGFECKFFFFTFSCWFLFFFVFSFVLGNLFNI